MNRTILAAILATAGFTAVAAGPLAAQTAPAPQDNADRTITRDEALAQADVRFDRMDANKDGKLDAAEMTARRQAAMVSPPPADGAAPPPPPAPGGRMMARLDANGDGAVDRSEFRAQAARRFDRVDANKDGQIDPAERQAARDAMGMRGGRAPGAGGDMPPPPADAPKPDAGQ
ncbi:MAG: EF-hand domain-containing protein [Sphingomonas sp.]